jgi:hypothetical protein
MNRFNPFSGMKPQVRDLNFQRDSSEQALRDRLIALTGDGTGIVKDVLGTAAVTFDSDVLTTVTIAGCLAYIAAERVYRPDAEPVTFDDVHDEANIIYLEWKLADSSDADGLRKHYLTGVQHQVWQEDSYELVAVKESQYVQTASRMKLYRFAESGGDLIKTNDYRVYLTLDPYLMNTHIEDREILTRQSAPPVPTRLRIETAFEDTLRAAADEVAGLVSLRQAYILAKFGDSGTGTASGNTFTKSSSDLTWTTNEWAGQYLTDSADNSFLVESNSSSVLTLQSSALPASGAFVLGPAAPGYRFLLEPLNPGTLEPVSHSQVEMLYSESPTKMEHIWHGLTPAVNYRVRVCSLGDWFQSSASAYCTPVDTIAGGAKVIPASCSDSLEAVTAAAVDSGIKLTWSRVGAYAAEISGVEIVWTDNGDTPNFANISQRHVYVTHDVVILPTRYSNPTTPTYVKIGMRCVDRAGRHCTTPIQLTPIEATVLAIPLHDLAAEVLLARGTRATLDLRMNEGSELDGTPKALSALEDEITSARSGYSSVKGAVDAISRAAVLWENVRIVAKTGGHYTTIQAAVTSVVTGPCLILIMPGTYSEDVDITDKAVDFLGLGRVQLTGRLFSSGSLSDVRLIDNIAFYNAEPTYAHPLLALQGDATICLRHCTFNYAGLEDAVTATGSMYLILHDCIFYGSLESGKVLLSIGNEVTCTAKHCRFKIQTSGTNACVKLLETGGSVILRLLHSTLCTGGTNTIIGSGTKANITLYMSHCVYKGVADSGTITIVVDVQEGTSSNSAFASENALSLLL